MNYVVLHLHSMYSNPYSGLEVDSITSFQEYVDEAKKCGMKAIAFTEHGCRLRNVAKKQYCEKAGIKCIQAEEFYVTENIDTDNLVRDNYHCCLYAKNYDGVLELNELSSKSFNKEDGHFYYNPRISLEELENTSDNIMVLTACVGGILCKGTNTAQERFLKFLIANKHRCWLEIQPHNFDMQIKYNQYLYRISQKYGLKLIATSDVHSINEDKIMGRKVMQKSKKVEFTDEDSSDLVWKNYDEIVAAFDKQSALPESVFLEAINETNNFADMIEDYELDYSHKYPRFKDSYNKFCNRILEGVKDRGINKLDNYKTEYLPRIKEELETYKHNDAIDFMILDSDYKRWLLKQNMHYGLSRGSVSGSLIAYLIKSTDVDSVKYNLNFSRFMNTERVSLADVDTDIYADDRYKVREYLFERDDLYCCNIVTFNTIKMKGAIKDVCRAYEMTQDEAQEISDQVCEDENGNEYVPDEVRNKHKDIFFYVDMVIGTVTSLGRHAAGIICSPTDVKRDFGLLSIKSDPRPVSQIDMHELDSLNYTKLDLLGLNAIGLIDKTCKLANIDFLTPDNVDLNDEKVIKSMAEDTTLIFQFESGFASDSLKQTLSEETLNNIKSQNKDVSYLDIISMVSGAIRPAGESYREQLFHGIYKDNGNKELNNFLKHTLGYLVYQEQIIDFLHDFCGYTMGQADIVRRHFAKKVGTENDIPIIENGGYMTDVHGNRDGKYIKGFVATAMEKYGMTEKEAREIIKSFLVVIRDASSYLFSRNHAIPYSMIGYFIAWLRYYYKIELLTAALNVYQENAEKISNIKEYIKSQGISLNPILFGKSKSEYFMDREENTIYQGVASIKYCNSKIAEELYELSVNNNYDNILDLIIDISTSTSTDNRQLRILALLNFFSDFCKNGKALQVIELYNAMKKSSSKELKTSIKKSDIEKLKINMALFEGCYGRESEKSYLDVDMKKYMYRVINNMEDKNLSVKEQIHAEKEYLENIVYVNKKAPKNLYYVCEMKFYKNKSKPYLLLYNVNDGSMLKTKITSASLFDANPFNENSFILIRDYKEKNKMKNVGGKWLPTDEKEKIVTSWDVY